MTKPYPELLTIAIPTFNRRESLLEVVGRARDTGVTTKARLVVFDDGSSDGTLEALEDLTYSGLGGVVRSPVNRGYGHTFVEIIRCTATRYVMVSTDDDFLCPKGVEAVQEDLRRCQPDLLVTAFPRHGRRPRSGSFGAQVRPNEIRDAFNHAPGIVYRAQAATPYLPIVASRLRDGCSMAAAYPQVLLGLCLAATHLSVWSKAQPVVEGNKLPSGIRRPDGLPYSAPQSRVEQMLDYDGFLEEHQHSLSTPQGARFVRKALENHRRRALLDLLLAFQTRTPNLAMALAWRSLLGLVLAPRRTLKFLLARRGHRREHDPEGTI